MSMTINIDLSENAQRRERARYIARMMSILGRICLLPESGLCHSCGADVTAGFHQYLPEELARCPECDWSLDARRSNYVDMTKEGDSEEFYRVLNDGDCVKIGHHHYLSYGQSNGRTYPEERNEHRVVDVKCDLPDQESYMDCESFDLTPEACRSAFEAIRAGIEPGPWRLCESAENDMDESSNRQCEEEERAERETWLAQASRDELVAEIRKLRDLLTETRSTMFRAHRLALDRIRCTDDQGVSRRSDPVSVVADLVAELEQARRERAMNRCIEKFLCDYRPDIVALLVACRRDRMARVCYGWPEAARVEYLRNPLVDSFFGVRTGYFNFERNRYWAAVVDAIPDGDSMLLERHSGLEIDLCEVQEQEGYEAGKRNAHDCGYDPQSLKARMWWHGHSEGRAEYLDALGRSRAEMRNP